jgi:hypothetical protein
MSNITECSVRLTPDNRLSITLYYWQQWVESGRSLYFAGVFSVGVLAVRGKWICPVIAFN